MADLREHSAAEHAAVRLWPFRLTREIARGQPLCDAGVILSSLRTKDVEDYFVNYQTPEGFDLPRLLNDDFWLAIKLVFNAGHYASCSKLLLFFVDSMAFVESGVSSGRAFQSCLNRYVELKPLRITAEELWEHRNALLHMTRLDSRRIEAGKVKRLIAYVGPLPLGYPTEDNDSKWFDLHGLMKAIAEGCSRYIASLRAEPWKIRAFADRYDLIVSYVRQERVIIE